MSLERAIEILSGQIDDEDIVKMIVEIDATTLERRQTEKENRCFVGNEILACYPTEGTTFVQDQYGKLIWNQNYPEFTNNGGYIDVYLFHEDDDSLQETWSSVENDEGRLAFLPQDNWWQGRTQADNFNGTNIAWPFYFVITYAGKGLDGKLNRLATWNAVQTALPVAVAQQRASASAASLSIAAAKTATPTPTIAASSDLASFSASLTTAFQASVRTEGLSGTAVLYTTATTTFADGLVATATASVFANGELPNTRQNGSSLHGKVIALIVVFGSISLIALVVTWYMCIRAVRKRAALRTQQRSVAFLSHSDTHSDTPMITAAANTTNVDFTTDRSAGEKSPTTPAGVHTSDDYDAHLNVDRGMVHVANADRGDEGEREPLTSSEVWRIANAFRSALRKPVLSARSSLGASAGRRRSNEVEADEDGAGGAFRRSLSLRMPSSDEAETPGDSQKATAQALLREDLEGEGRELKSVSDRRRPQLHIAVERR